MLVVQEHESENLISLNTKSNQGLTSQDDNINILEQHQVVCKMKLWYQNCVCAILGRGIIDIVIMCFYVYIHH